MRNTTLARIYRKIKHLTLKRRVFQDVSDEVLAELKRCQSELQSVATKNKKILQHLLQVVKTEFKRQQIKNQIKVVNSEVSLRSFTLVRIFCNDFHTVFCSFAAC